MLSAVTVHYGSKDHVARLVRQMEDIPLVRQLIVVNHDGPGCLKGPLPDKVRIVEQGNRGYGAGLNRGLQELGRRSQFALLCNPDVVIRNPEAISEVLDYMRKHPRAVCVVPALEGKDGGLRDSCRRFYTPSSLLLSRIPKSLRSTSALRRHLYQDHDRTRPFDIDWGCGAAMFVRVPLFPEQLRFDDRFFMYFEDVDVCLRVWESGYRVVYFPRLRCFHEESGTSRRDPAFFAMHVASLMKFITKHRGFPQRHHAAAAGGAGRTAAHAPHAQRA